MKKAFMLIAAIAMLAAPVFAQDAEVAEPTVEERVTALEAAPAPLTVTGSIEFGIGANLSTDETNNPVFTDGSAATATLGLATADEKVEAELTIDLLAIPSVESVMDNVNEYAFANFEDVDSRSQEQTAYDTLTSLITWFNDNNEASATKDDVAFFDAADSLTLLTAINTTATTTIGMAEADVLDIVLYSPETVGTTIVAGDEAFILTGSNVANVLTAVNNALNLMMIAAMDQLAVDSPQATVTTILDNDANILYTSLVTAVNDGLSQADTVAMVQADLDALNDALSLTKSFTIATAELDPMGITTTVAKSMLSGAKIKINEIGGVVDMTMNFDGQHASAGNINLDLSGHQEDAVTGYPSLAIALSEGVVSGLSVDAALYINSTNGGGTDGALQVAISDDVFTWEDETETVEDPKLGFSVGAGYTLPIGDMSVGADLAFAMYDLAATAAPLGFAAGASFAGFDANVGVDFEIGLGLTVFGASADYTIFGITPSVAFTMISGTPTADGNYVWNDDTSNTYEDFTHAGGIKLETGLNVDLGQFLPFAASVGGSFDLIKIEAATDSMMWFDANLSVTPLEGLTVGGWLGMYFGAAASAAEELRWNANVSYTIIGITASAGVGSDYDSDREDFAINWNAGLGYTLGSAALKATVGTAYDADDGAEVVTWGLNCKVTF